MPKLLPENPVPDKDAPVNVGILGEYINASTLENIYLALLKRIESLKNRINILKAALNNYSGGGVPTSQNQYISFVKIIQNNTVLYRKDPAVNQIFICDANRAYDYQIFYSSPIFIHTRYYYEIDGVKTYIDNYNNVFNFAHQMPNAGDTLKITVGVEVLDESTQTFSAGNFIPVDIYLQSTGVFYGINPDYTLNLSIYSNLPAVFNKNVNVRVYTVDPQGNEVWYERDNWSSLYGVIISNNDPNINTPIVLAKGYQYSIKLEIGTQSIIEGHYYASDIFSDSTTYNKVVNASDTILNIAVETTPSDSGPGLMTLNFVDAPLTYHSTELVIDSQLTTPREGGTFLLKSGKVEMYQFSPNSIPVKLYQVDTELMNSSVFSPSVVTESEIPVYAIGYYFTAREDLVGGAAVVYGRKSGTYIYNKFDFPRAKLYVYNSGQPSEYNPANQFQYLDTGGGVLDERPAPGNLNLSEDFVGVTLGYTSPLDNPFLPEDTYLDVTLYAESNGQPVMNDVRGKGRLYFEVGNADNAVFRARNFIYISNLIDGFNFEAKYYLKLDIDKSPVTVGDLVAGGDESLKFNASDIEGVVEFWAREGTFISKTAVFYYA